MGGVHWITLTYLFFKKFHEIASAFGVPACLQLYASCHAPPPPIYDGMACFCGLAFDKNVAIAYSLTRKLNILQLLGKILKQHCIKLPCLRTK